MIKIKFQLLLKAFAGFCIVLFLNYQVKSQTKDSISGDSISLNYIIKVVVNNYPSVKIAEEAINQINAKIKLAKSAYYPNIDITGSYTRIGPVPTIVFPPFGSFEMAPANNYNASLNYNQEIYNFGGTEKNVKYEKENKEITKLSLEQMKENLSLMATNSFYALIYLQEAIQINIEQLNTLNKHLEFIEKKKETGSATQYEILTIKVKISDTESKKLDLEIEYKIQLSILNSLLGIPDSTPHFFKKEFNIKMNEAIEDSMISYAINHRNEIKMAKQKVDLAELHYKIIKAQYYPSLGIYASAGDKNGYFPELNQMKANYSAGLGIRIPVYDGSRTYNNLVQAESLIQTSNYDVELARRKVSNEIIENEANLRGSSKKIEHYTLQLALAKEAYGLAETSYKDGIITNLDLLDSETALSESQLLLLKSRIDYLLSVYRLKVALGEIIY